MAILILGKQEVSESHVLTAIGMKDVWGAMFYQRMNSQDI